jgi:Glycosyl hydrolase family 30 TIM-barrel domain
MDLTSKHGLIVSYEFVLHLLMLNNKLLLFQYFFFSDFVAWLDAFKAAGVNFWGITPQNEPEAIQPNFESCAYSPTDMRDFIAQYLGPTLATKYSNLFMLGYEYVIYNIENHVSFCLNLLFFYNFLFSFITNLVIIVLILLLGQPHYYKMLQQVST